MERQAAIKLIQKIIGNDLRKLAEKYEITVFKDGKKNKGWAGHVLERYLGLPINSSQSPNFGSWELKTISLKRLASGELTVKETMAITMIDAYNVSRTNFADSHLLAKMSKMLLVARIWESQDEPESQLYGIYEFNLSDPDIINQVKEDYELVQNTIINEGFKGLTGAMGVFVQPRTKGAGHGSTSRAFYARTGFLKAIIGI